MYVKQALKLFGSRAKIAQALGGARHRSAVYQWDLDGLVPMGAALILTKKANEPFNSELYDRYQQNRNRQLAKARAARHK